MMTNELTYATVCSGIECMSVACRGLPMRPVFFSEIEPFPCAVLKAHYPDVPNLGDMSKIQVSNDGKEITNGTVRIILDRRIDILAGGTPCQDVSVAGKRAGMQEGSGTRSSLAFDFVRLARELRPRYIIWENVAGAIDSKNAPDFLAFLRALGDCGYSLAWRVLDAQYVRVDGVERAVPQRRRRVWVVGCLGEDESIPAQILFEPDCVAGHTAPRRRTGQGFAYALAGRDRVDAGVVGGAPGDGGGEARASARGGQGQAAEHRGVGDAGHLGRVQHDGGGREGTAGGVDVLNFQGSKGNNCVTRDGSCPTLNAMHGHDVHVVALDGEGCRAFIPYGTRLGPSPQGIAQPLTRIDSKFQQCIALDGDKLKPREDQRKGGKGFGINEEGVGYTLTCVDRHGVAYGIDQQGGKGGANTTEGVAPTVLSDSHGTPHGVAYCADGGEVASTITRQISEQSGQDNRANAVVQCYENHAQDSRIKPIEVSDTRNQKDGTGGNNLPLVCFSKVAHASAPNGEGERWDEREVAQTRNTFDNGEKRCQEVVVSMAQNTRDEVRIVGGDGQIAGALPAEPGMKQQTYIVSTNSNGEDVAATLDHNTGSTNGIGAQNDKRGGYVVTRQGGAMIDKQLNTATLDEAVPTIVSTTSKEAPCLAIQTEREQ